MRRYRLPLYNPAVVVQREFAWASVDPVDPPTSEPYLEEPPGFDPCVRSPCDTYQGLWDPKADKEALEAARRVVAVSPGLKDIRGIVGYDTIDTGKVYPRDGQYHKKGDPKLKTVPIWQDFKDYHRPGLEEWPLAVSYGIGIDSTAILVGLAQLYRKTGDDRFVPRWITFADTGWEKAETYGYLEIVENWLQHVGFPRVQVVGASQYQLGWFGISRTLEQKCLMTHTMPSISVSGFKRSECSVTWKQDPQNAWFRYHSGLFVSGPDNTGFVLAVLAEDLEKEFTAKEVASLFTAVKVETIRKKLNELHSLGYASKEKRRSSFYQATPAGLEALERGEFNTTKPQLPPDLRIVKAIGYDATETDRLDNAAKGSTFRAGDNPEKDDYAYWYPLMEWGWDRARCYAEIEAEIGYVPPKSSCTGCGAMKPPEIAKLSKGDLLRCLLVEQVFLRGRNPPDSPSLRGLGFGWTWSNFARGIPTQNQTEEARQIIAALERPLVSEQEFAEVVDTAEEWIARFPGQGKPTWRSLDKPYHVIAEEMGLAAFTDPRGLRDPSSQLMGWERGAEEMGWENPPGLPYDPLLDGSL